MEIAGEKIFPRSIGPVGFGPSRAVAKIEVSYYNGATACNIGSSALLVQLISLSAYQPSLKQIEFAAAVHLPSDELEAGDLPLGLSVGPGRYDCRANRRFIVRYAAGGDKAGASALDPGWQLGGGSAPDHPMEFGYDLSSSTRVGTPASTAATVIVSAFESVSRPTVMRRAIVLADGIR